MTTDKSLLPIGAAAPDFCACASDGTVITLSEYRDRAPLVLLFYPGDYTPVCTAQLCSVRDRWKEFEAAGAVVLGVNPMSGKIHAAFASHSKLPFPLLHDRHGEISHAYGCRGMFGMTKRTVYVVDRQGRIALSERGTPDLVHVIGAVRAVNVEP